MINLLKKYKVFIFIVIFLLIKVIFIVFTNVPFNTLNTNEKIEQKSKEEDKVKEEENVENKVFVDVKGAVVNPGLYEVDSSYRVGQVIDKAGGFSHANTQCVNLSQKIFDEQLIYIPSKSQKCETLQNNSQKNNLEQKNVTNNESSSLININTATKEELVTLEGVGESRAGDIIKYREENGGFTSIEDIQNVSGIGESTYENIKDQITV